MMKQYIFLLMALLFMGCEYLDKEPDDMKTDKMVWSNRNEVLKYLTNCYGALPMDDLHRGDPWLGCSDECDIPWAVYPTYGINLGNWEPATNFYVTWNLYYRAIRSTFVFENNVGKCGELSKDLKDRYLGEALFLRGYYYFLLLRQYGPVVLLKELMPNDTNFGNIARTPFDQCVEYVCEMMNRAETLLPLSYASEPECLGRATIPACRAVKASALMLAASPQWNGNKDYAQFVNHDGTPLASTQYDENKWRKAAEAAKSVIELSETKLAETGLELYTGGVNIDSDEYNPYKAYYDLFNTGWNSEIIFGSIDQGSGSWDSRGPRYAWMIHCIPTGVNCMGAVGPTLRLVDAFYMENGRTIEDPQSNYVERGFATSDGPHYNPNKVDQNDDKGRKKLLADLKSLDAWGHSKGDWNMFCNREARFYASVNYNHRVQLPYSDDAAIRNKLNKTSQQDGWGRVELYRGGTSNSGENLNFPMTGFLAQKRIVPCDFYNNTMPGKYVSIYIRYAQILLDYIEALNEYDPSNADIQKYWDQIRKRAGLPSIFETYPSIRGDQDQQREYILRERQVELNFEGDRYFTTRRRLLCETPDLGGATDDRKYGDSGRVWGLSVEAGDPKTNNFKSTEFYTRKAFESRVFRKEYYLFPIPQTEIDKSPALVQNPWW